MKKTLFILLVFLGTKNLLAQEENYTVDDLLLRGLRAGTTAIAGMTPQNIASKILMERSGAFAYLSAFHQGVNKSNVAYFEQALTDIYMASNQNQFTDFEGLRNMVSEETETENEVSVGILNTSYETINYNPKNPKDPNNGFTYIEGVSLTPIVGKQQFIDHHTTVVSPLKDFVKGDVIKFKFSADLLFSNGKTINTLRADLGDGAYRTIIDNGTLQTKEVSIPIAKSARVEQTYQITYTGGETQRTKSTLYARSVSNPPDEERAVNTEDFQYTSRYGFPGYSGSRPYKGIIQYRIFYASADKILRKPVFILDGFDPGDQRKIERVDYDNPEDEDKDPSIYRKMKYLDEEDNKLNLVETLRQDKGYDVVVCNFPKQKIGEITVCTANPGIVAERCFQKAIYIDGGADFVERNGLAFVSLIQDINQKLVTNGSNEQLVVMGPSMGGIISRYALAHMEKMEAETNDAIWDHNTKLWVSIDAPHLGANIPIGIQALINIIGNVKGDVGAMSTYRNSLKSVTAKQFLINQHKEGGTYHHLDYAYMNGRVLEQGYTTEGGGPFYKQFYKALYTNGLPNSNGFPMNLRKVAIANGNAEGTRISSDAQETFYTRGYILWGATHVSTLGIWNLPSFDRGTHRISKFKKSFDTKTAIGANYSRRGNFDILPGGYTDTYETVRKEAETNDLVSSWEVATNIENHSFIPTASALAIKNPQSDWGRDFRRDYFCDDENFTPFDNFYIPNSGLEEHIQITNENVAWLLQELEGVRGSIVKEINNIDVVFGTLADYTSNGTLSVANGVVRNGAQVNFRAKHKIVFHSNLSIEAGAEVFAETSGTVVDCADIVRSSRLAYEEPVFLPSDNSLEAEVDNAISPDITRFPSGTEQITLGPNPSHTTIKISAAENTTIYKVEVYDLLTREKKMTITDRFDFIEVTSLTQGFYVVKITTSEGVVTRQMLKN